MTFATANDQVVIGDAVVPQTARNAILKGYPGFVADSHRRRSTNPSTLSSAAGDNGGHQEPAALISPWRPAITAACVRYGDEWLDAVTNTVRDLVEGAHERGMSPIETAASFVGSDSRPDLDSPGGKALLSRLPIQLRDTLSDPQAVVGVQAIIGDAVAPRIVRDTEDIAMAVASAVSDEDKNQARNVAIAMGVHPQDLGGYFGSIGQFVTLAQKHGAGRPENAGGSNRQRAWRPQAVASKADDSAKPEFDPTRHLTKIQGENYLWP